MNPMMRKPVGDEEVLTKTDVNRMKKAELQQLAERNGVDPGDMTADELREAVKENVVDDE